MSSKSFLENVQKMKRALLSKALCRDGKIRTCDLLVPNQARYRATLHPELLTYISPFSFNASIYSIGNDVILLRTFAERVGVEPTVQFNPYDDLANRSFRPLRHLSETCPFTFVRGCKNTYPQLNKQK